MNVLFVFRELITLYDLINKIQYNNLIMYVYNIQQDDGPWIHCNLQ